MLLTVDTKENSIDSALFLSPPGNWSGVVGAMKPGAHLLLFSDVGNHHLGTIAAEDNGLEIRDTIAWVFSDENDDTAMQLIAMARKPLQGTVAENVLKWGTGGLNIDECRVGTEPVSTHSRGVNGAFPKRPGERSPEDSGRKKDQRDGLDHSERAGRWPANLTHDNNPLITPMFPETGPAKSGGKVGWQDSYVGGNYKPIDRTGYDDNGGSASRFFYSAPSFENLIAYLLKLVTPKNGTVFTNCNTDSLPKEYNYVTDCRY